MYSYIWGVFQSGFPIRIHFAIICFVILEKISVSITAYCEARAKREALSPGIARDFCDC